MDPLSLEETKREVQAAKTQATAKPAALGLDERGLPPGYAFKPDWEVTPRETKTALDKGTMVIDVREPHEWDITHIVDKDKLFPRAQWTQIPIKLKGHENDRIIVHCKSGGRSLQVAQMLRQAGYSDVKSMAGGISLWNKDVNPGGPQY
jgi:adenylyltransferase/sulfurtransferase